MPKVKSKKSKYDEYEPEDVRISSVIFGAVMVVAIIVAVAAWMGGSLNKVGSQFGNTMDGAARGIGLSVKSVTIIGLEHDPALTSDIKAAAMIEPGENMFRADPHAIQRRVESTNKVLNVRVHRLWPDQIIVIADAAQPIALFNDGQTWNVVDSLGRTAPEPRPQDYADLIRLSGDGSAKAAPHLAASFASAPELYGKAVQAHRVADRRWDILLSTGVTVRLPGDEDLERAARRLAHADMQSAITKRRLKVIDMRAPQNIYMKPASTPAPASTSGAA